MQGQEKALVSFPLHSDWLGLFFLQGVLKGFVVLESQQGGCAARKEKKQNKKQH